MADLLRIRCGAFICNLLPCASRAAWVVVLVALRPTSGAAIEPAASTKAIPASIQRVLKLSLGREHVVSDDNGTQKTTPYRLFLPRPFDPNRPYPLILWLHGAGGELGSDNWGQLRYIGTHIYGDDDGAYPFFLLAPQCPDDYRGGSWFDVSSTSYSQREDELLTIAMEIADDVRRNYLVDSERQYIIGISSGGTAAFEAVARYPKRFAAIVPLASSGAGSRGVEEFMDTPIWAFHARADQDTSVDGVRRTITSIADAGGRSYLTETPGTTHDCWTPALKEFGALDWLLSQRLGEVGPPPKTFRLANEIQLVKQGGLIFKLPLPAAIVFAWWLMKRNKHKARTASVETLPVNETAEAT